ncbi:MAG: cisplatin damage response ATP-dependent DNA ligase, partial [Xanthobacteraceae bacterium]
MNRFAALLDRLAFEHGRNNKIRLMTEHFRNVPDPERGWALAALTGALSFRHAKPSLIHGLVAERTDPVLFGLSYDYVGDLSETVALIWPAPRSEPIPPPQGEGGGRGPPGGGPFPESRPHPAASRPPSPFGGAINEHAPPSVQQIRAPTLSEVVTALATLGKAELPGRLAHWLDSLDETGRWALLKLVTGALRIGVSARLAKTAVAALGGKDPDEIELIWPGLEPPYLELFAWVEGRGDKPMTRDPAPFRPVMLAHAIEEPDLAALDPADFLAEYKWDGIRVQAVAGARADGRRAVRLYSRTGDDISGSFPDLTAALDFTGAIDGELLVKRDGRVQPFNVLQQRLNRKTVTPKLIADYPAHLRAYDLLVDGEEDVRERPFPERRARLEALVARLASPRVDLSPLIPFATWDELIAARADPTIAGADADAVEGVMLKRRDAPYLPGRPKGLWWKWKRDPF